MEVETYQAPELCFVIVSIFLTKKYLIYLNMIKLCANLSTLSANLYGPASIVRGPCQTLIQIRLEISIFEHGLNIREDEEEEKRLT